MTKEKSESSGEDREGSSARTESPASDQIAPPTVVRNATDSPGNPAYAIRKCRGSHWHVTCCGEDLAIRGDPFYDIEEAQSIADRLNAGAEPDDFHGPPPRAAIRGILGGLTRVSMESDAARMDWLEAQGVVSIYFRDGSQFNPASLSLRAALDLAVEPSRSTLNHPTGTNTDV